jgi:predicted transcriptional regulator
MEDEGAKRGRGRPRTSPEGRGNTLTITINPHTRAALEEASAKLNRSLSQTAEQAIERGRIVGDLGAAGAAVADVLQTMLRVAANVERTLGDPTLSIEARDELRRRWAEIAKEALPNVEPASAARQAAAAAVSAMRFAAMEARESRMRDLHGEKEDAVARRLRHIAMARLFPGAAGWADAHSDLTAASLADDGATGANIATVLLLAAGAESAIRRTGDAQ